MTIEVRVICMPAGDSVGNLRGILCDCQRSKEDANPLMSTKFNDELEKVVQEAFDDGRKYEASLKKGAAK